MTSILVDLDGTVCDARHRAHMISGKDGEPNWDDYSLACSADKPVHGVIRLVAELHDAGNRIVIASGRAMVAMERTIQWLYSNHVRHDVIAEVIKQSREAARGMMMMKNPQIARDAVETMRKKKMGE